MLVRIAVFTRHDINPLEEFPHEYSAWVDGDVVQRKITGGDLERGVVDVQMQTRTIATEGLHGASRQAIGPIVPPRYPPIYVCRYDCDHSIVGDVHDDSRFYVLSVDLIEEGEELPDPMQERGWAQPIPEDVFTEFSGRVEAVTRNLVGDEAGRLIAAKMAQWRSANPAGTPDEFCAALRKYVS
jgi:hypothetical protein